MMDREASVLETIIELGLSPKHIKKLGKNPSKDSPYHNNQHLYTVALYVDEAAKHYQISLPERQLLFMSALYHDYAHSAGTHSDTVNISRAITATIDHVTRLETFSMDEMDTIANIIHATIQPPSLHGDPISLLQGIIMDADMLQCGEPDAEKFLSGLALEGGFEVTWSTTKDFLSRYVPKTSWGKEKISSLIARI